MASGRTVRVEFPLAGVDRALGFQKQRPFTTPDAMNVRAVDQEDGRMIGGTRPGLEKFDTTQLGSADNREIRLLNSVNVVPLSATPTHRNEFLDDFGDPNPPTDNLSFGHYFRYETADVGVFFNTELGLTEDVIGGLGGVFKGSPPGSNTAPAPLSRRPGGYWLEEFQPPIVVTAGSATTVFGVKTAPFLHTNGVNSYCDTVRLYITDDATLTRVAAEGTTPFTQNDKLPQTSPRFTGLVITLVRSVKPEGVYGTVQDPYDLRDDLGNPRFDKIIALGLFQVRVDECVAGVITRKATFDGNSFGEVTDPQPGGVAAPGWFTATIGYLTTGAELRINYHGELVGTLAIPDFLPGLASNARRFGFSVTNNLGAIEGFTYRSYITNTKLQWSSASTTFETAENLILAGANGRIFGKNASLVMADTDVNSPVDIALDHDCPSGPWLQRLYISDYGRITEGTCQVASSEIQFNGTAIDFSSFALDANDHICVLFDTPDPETQDGSYSFTLTGTSPQTMTLTDYPRGLPTTVDIPANQANFRIERAPKLYDPQRPGVDLGETDGDTIQATSKLHRWKATAGLVPAGCPILVPWLGTVVLAGPSYAPHAWFMSRQGVWTDFDYGQVDVAAAVADITFDRGSIGLPITAVVPHTKDYLFFASLESIVVLIGHPRQNGYMEELSPIGIVSRQAWAHDPDGRLLFLSREGLYVQPPGLTGRPQQFSKRRLPRELIEFDSAKSEVALVYDNRDSVFHLFIKSLSGATSSVWAVDLNTESLWPARLGNSEFQPTMTHRYRAFKAEDSDVILGSRDGFLRRFRRDAPSGSDTGADFDQHVWIGPLNISPDGDMEGVITELGAVLPLSSGPVDWSLHVGDWAETAFTAPAIATGQFTAGNNPRFRPRARGMAAFVKLSSNNAAAWSLEHLLIRVKRGGRRRL